MSPPPLKKQVLKVLIFNCFFKDRFLNRKNTPLNLSSKLAGLIPRRHLFRTLSLSSKQSLSKNCEVEVVATLFATFHITLQCTSLQCSAARWVVWLERGKETPSCSTSHLCCLCLANFALVRCIVQCIYGEF